MLTINILNDGTGTNESSNYEYAVFVNNVCIATGQVKGHNREDGWIYLLSELTTEAHSKEVNQ